MSLVKPGLHVVLFLVTLVAAGPSVLAGQGASPQRDDRKTPASPAAAANPNADALPAGAIMRFGADRFRYEGGALAALAFAPDGTTLFAVPENGGALYSWDSSTGKSIRRAQLERRLFQSSLALSADGKRVAGWVGQNVSVWDLPLSDSRPPKIIPMSIRPWQLAFTADGNSLLAVTLGGEVCLWDLKTGELRKQLNLQVSKSAARQPGPVEKAMAGRGGLNAGLGMQQMIRSLATSPDGKVIITTLRGGPASFWDMDGKPLKGFPDDALFCAFAPDGKTLAYSSPNGVFLWDLIQGKQRVKLTDQTLRAGAAVAFSPDGTRVAASSLTQLLVWETATGKQSHQLTGLSASRFASIHTLCFSPDGKTLVDANGDSSLRVWNLETGKEKFPEAGQRSAITQIAFSPDGRRLATAAVKDSEIRSWEVATGRVEQTLSSPSHGHGLLYSRDGQSLIADGGFQGLHIWNIASGESLRDLKLPAGPDRMGPGNVQSIALQPDGVTLSAIGIRFNQAAFAGDRPGVRAGVARGQRKPEDAVQPSDFGRLISWDMFTGKPNPVQEFPSEPESQWLLSPDGSLRASFNKPVCKVFDSKSGKLVASLDCEYGTIHVIAFSADSKKIAGLCNQAFQQPQVAVWWDLPSGKPVGRVKTPLQTTMSGDGSLRTALAFSPDGKILATAGEAGAAIQLWDTGSGKEVGRFTGVAETVTSLAFAHGGHALASGLSNGIVLLWDVGKAAPAAPVVAKKSAPRSLPPFRKPLSESPRKLPGAHELIRQLLQEARGLSEKIEPPYFRARLLGDLAIAMASVGEDKLKRATFAELKRLYAQGPTRPILELENIALPLAQAGDAEETKKALAGPKAAALELGLQQPLNALCYTITQALARAGNLNEALEINKEVPGNDDLVESHRVLGALAALHFAQIGDLARALALVDSISSAAAKNYALLGTVNSDRWNNELPTATFGLAIQLQEAGQQNAAKQVVGRAENLAPTIQDPGQRARSWSTIVCCWARLGDLDAARAALAKIPQDSEFRPYALMALARARASIGQSDKAVSIVKGLKTGRLQSEGYYEMALGQLAHGDRVAALEFCERASELIQTYGDAFAATSSLGQVHVNAQDYEGAAAIFEKVRPSPAFARGYGAIAANQASLGDYAAALVTIEGHLSGAGFRQIKTQQLRNLAKDQTEHNREQEALTWAKKRTTAEDRAYALLGIAEGLLKRR